MQAFDKFLGPLAPHRQAARTAPRTRHVLVMDATSEQGRSVCESLIKDNRWVVWGLVEDKEDVIAKALLAMQVKLIVGSLSMPASYESHLKDKDGVFLHVDFEELHERANGDEDDYHKTADAEIAWTTKLVDACVRENVRHFVYSALDQLPGNLSVPHCYAKSQVVKYIKSTSLPTTFLYTSTPFSYILWKHTLQSQPDGTFLLDLPVPDDCVLPGYPTEQTGEWVKMALKGGDKWIGKDMTACTEKATPVEFAAVLEKLGGKKVDTHHLSREEFLSEDHRESLGDVTWSHYKAFYEGAIDRDVKKSESVVPFQWSFRQWAGQNPEIKRILAGEKEAPQGQ